MKLKWRQWNSLLWTADLPAGRICIVQLIGASWGYMVWNGDEMECGKRGLYGDWNAEDALNHAAAFLRENYDVE